MKNKHLLAAQFTAALLILVQASLVQAQYGRGQSSPTAITVTSGNLVFGRSFYVRTSGSDSNNGQNKNQAFKTIFKAAQVAGPGDIVYVGAGTYQHTDTITFNNTQSWSSRFSIPAKSVNLKVGSDTSFTLYNPCYFVADTNGTNTGDAGPVKVMAPKDKSVWTFYLNQINNYAFSGFTFVEDPTSKAYKFGESNTHNTPAGGWLFYGIGAYGGGDFAFISCNFEGFYHALHTNSAQNVTLYDCQFTKSRYMSVYPYMSTKWQMEECQLGTNPVAESAWGYTYPFYGVYSDIKLRNSTYDGAGAGRAGDNWCNGLWSYGPADNTTTAAFDVRGCLFKNASYYAVGTSWAKTCKITNNSFQNCRYAIHGHAADVAIQNNILEQKSDAPGYKQWSWGIFSYGEKVTSSQAWGTAGFKATKTPVICTNNSIKGYYLGVYVGGNNTDLTGCSIEGYGCDPYVSNGNGGWQVRSDWQHSYGIYMWGSWYQTDFTSTGPWAYRGCDTFTLTGAQNVTLKTCGTAIVGGETDVTLDGVTLENHWDGINSNGKLTLRNCNVKNIKSTALALWLPQSVTLDNTKFSNNGNGPDGKSAWAWTMYYYGRKDRTFENRFDTTNYWDYQPGDSTVTIKKCTVDGSGYGFWLGGFKGKNCSFSDNVLNGKAQPYDATTGWGITGYGLSLAGGDYQLTADNEFKIENFYIGIYGWNNNSLSVAKKTITKNVHGLYSSTNKSVDVSKCDISNNYAYGFIDYYTTALSLSDTTANNNAYYGILSYGHWYLPEYCQNLSLKNVTANGNGYYGLYVWEPASVDVRGLTCNDNKYWGTVLYTNYGKYIWDEIESYRSYFKDGKRPTYVPSISFQDVTAKKNHYSGGLHFYSYEGTGSTTPAKDKPWLRSDSQYIALKNITCDDNMWYGIYLGYCTCLDSKNSSLNLETKNNYYGIVFNGQSVVLDGLRGMNIRDNAYGLCVWYGNATLRNLNMAVNTWDVYCHGWYDPGTNNQNPSPGYGKFAIQNCTFDGGGLELDYPSSLSIKDTTVKNATRYVAYGRPDYGTWQPGAHGIYTWRHTIPMTLCEYKNVTVNGAYWYGLHNSGYYDVNAVLDNVTVDNCNYHGAVIHHTSYTMSNSKFRNNGKLLSSNGQNYVGYYGFVDSPDTYNFSTNAWTPIRDKATVVTNCEFSGNARYGFVHYYSPLTMTNCTGNDNGYGLYSYEANATFTNCTANNNYNRDYANSGWIGMISYGYQAPYSHVFKNCTANGNYGYGIEIYNPNRSLSGTPTATVENCTTTGNAYDGLISYWCKTDTKNSVSSGNRGQGFLNVFNDVTMTGCVANNNGQPNSWSSSPNWAMGIYNHGGYYYEDTPATPNYFAHAGKILDDQYGSNGYANVLKKEFNRHVVSNCTVNGNYYIGAMNVYDEGSFTNCQANNNTYYGFHFGHGREDGVLSSVVDSCTANGNGSIAFYQYDATTNISNCSSANSGYGLYLIGTWYRYEPKPITVRNCTVTGGSGHGVTGYYANVDLGNVAANGFQGWNMYAAYSNMLASNCTFNNGRGGVVTVYDKSDAFRDCQAVGNTADWGLITQYADSFVAERCQVMNNGNWGLGSYFNKSAVLKNNIVAGNLYGTWIGDTGSGAEVWNNTITNNKNNYGLYAYTGAVNVRNNIITNNGAYGLGSYQATMNHSHNLVSGHTPGTDFWKSGWSATQAAAMRTPDEPNKPPRFMDATSGDYRLAKGSPAINAGMNAPGVVDADMLGNSRPMYGVTEIGAYEFLDKSGSIRPLTWSEKK